MRCLCPQHAFFVCCSCTPGFSPFRHATSRPGDSTELVQKPSSSHTVMPCRQTKGSIGCRCAQDLACHPAAALYHLTHQPEQLQLHSHSSSLPNACRRMEFSIRCAYAHGTSALRTHLINMAPKQIELTWPAFSALRKKWAGKVCLQTLLWVGCGRPPGRGPEGKGGRN